MVDLGANVIATDNVGKTPYDLAVQRDEEDDKEEEEDEKVSEYLKEQIIALIDKKDTFSEDESK